ncbi:MAG: hypothetical protein HYS98_08190 [Deltaproteobacteria bacterium]|nr:hypothetical protein [Deltaproteobacteria bacterium]
MECTRQFVQEQLKGVINEAEIGECQEYLAWLILLQVPEYFNRLSSDEKIRGNVFSRSLARAAAYILEYHRLHLEYKKQEEANDFFADLWRNSDDSYTLSYPVTRIDGTSTSVESTIPIDGEEIAAGMHAFYITSVKDKYGLTDALVIDIRSDDNENRGLEKGAQIVLPILNYPVVTGALQDPSIDLKALLKHVRPDFTRFK